MRSIMSRTPYESSFSFSRRHFHRIIAKVELGAAASSDADPSKPRGALARLKSALASAIARRAARSSALGPRVVGTLFGRRRGHVRFAFQIDPRAAPAMLVELAMPTSSLIREMASGLVRIALESEPSAGAADGDAKLLEERSWRAFCNGKKCGYAVRRECGEADWRVLRAVEPVSMGAGVLPAEKEGAGGDGK
ncbi:hypothetical protein KSP39_PZI015635 [Platanthera zijinensis]|uniref:Uncharacterized protein n=1 Tax=Platanthera zijinensis TaxID=2320716 RepID=A0AAP0B822_9ASPA